MRGLGTGRGVTWESQACDAVLAVPEPEPGGRGGTQRPQNPPLRRRAISRRPAPPAASVQKPGFAGSGGAPVGREQVAAGVVVSGEQRDRQRSGAHTFTTSVSAAGLEAGWS